MSTQPNRIDQLLKLLVQNPHDTFLCHALGLEYISRGDSTQARAYFEKVLAIDAHYLGTYYQLAKLYESIDRTRASELYEQGMQEAKAQNDMHTLAELRIAYEDFCDI